ncbi:hypothetical protein P3697_19695, partial [Vibrio parahaemolyticus]|nr:hypothetical protein [Vibrio parahaemolyticus]
ASSWVRKSRFLSSLSRTGGSTTKYTTDPIVAIKKHRYSVRARMLFFLSDERISISVDESFPNIDLSLIDW